MHIAENRTPAEPELLRRPPQSTLAPRQGQRLKEEQILAVLKEWEAGAKTLDLCRRYGVSQRAFYRWKVRFRGLLGRLRELEEENSRLRRLVADSFLANQALRELNQSRSV